MAMGFSETWIVILGRGMTAEHEMGCYEAKGRISHGHLEAGEGGSCAPRGTYVLCQGTVCPLSFTLDSDT